MNIISEIQKFQRNQAILKLLNKIAEHFLNHQMIFPIKK